MIVKTESLEFFNKKHLVHKSKGPCILIDEVHRVEDEFFLKDWNGDATIIFEIQDRGRFTGEPFTVTKEYDVTKYDDILFEAKLKK